MPRPLTRIVAIALTTLCFAPALARAADKAADEGEQVMMKSMKFLMSQQQPNGSWQRGEREPVAITALVLRAMTQAPGYSPDAPAVKKAVEFLLSQQQPDGGIYKGALQNYNTAICISGLAAVGDPKLKEPIAKAVAYLKANQFNDSVQGLGGEKIDSKHPYYGGWGYGGTKGRPDVSNAAIVIEALKDAGMKTDDPSYIAALEFVSKMQNNSETNPSKWAGDDGGFIYSPGKSGDGESSAGEYNGPDGKRMLRSYGSMTYAGIKSMMYAGLSKDDPRVKAAWGWITKTWTLDENPGMAAAGPEQAKAGIYYYYHTLARSLKAYGEPKVASGGKDHDWRVELIAKLKADQKPDGSYTGDKKWMEDNPVIATAMATLALQDALADLKAKPAK